MIYNRIEYFSLSLFSQPGHRKYFSVSGEKSMSVGKGHFNRKGPLFPPRLYRVVNFGSIPVKLAVARSDTIMAGLKQAIERDKTCELLALYHFSHRSEHLSRPLPKTIRVLQTVTDLVAINLSAPKQTTFLFRSTPLYYNSHLPSLESPATWHSLPFVRDRPIVRHESGQP